MKNPKPNILSYLAALIIGVILFATVWKSIFGSVSSPVVISGILGVAVAVVLLVAVSRFRRPKD